MAAAAIPWIIGGATAFQALGSIHQANSQAAAYKTQAQASNYNAAVSRLQERQARQVSSAQQMQLRREQRQFFGRQRAMAAQSGVGEGGSNADLMEQSQTLAELDVLNIAYEGELRAKGYATQAELDDFYTNSYRSQAKNVKRAGRIKAVGDILTGGYMAAKSTVR